MHVYMCIMYCGIYATTILYNALAVGVLCTYVCDDCVSEVKGTEVHYAVSPQALSDESKHSGEGKSIGEGKQTRVALDYDYASTGPISVR